MAIVIDVKLAQSRTDSVLGRLEKAIDKLDTVVAKMHDGLRETASYVERIAAGLKDAAGSTRQISSGAATAQRIYNRRPPASSMLAVQPPPTQSWEDIREGYRAGAAAGDPDSVRKFLQADQQLRRKARARKLALGEGDSIQDILGRTRFANVFGMTVPMPLGRDLKQLGGMAGINVGKQFAGAGSMLAPLAGAVAPVVLALTAMTVTAAAWVKVTQEGHKAIRDFTVGLNTVGGTGRQAGGALLAGSAVGLGAGDISGLGARIGSDPIARSVAAKAGIPTLRGDYGDINDAEAGRKALRYIASIEDPTMRRREAIGLGDPRLADFGRLNPGLQNRLLNPAMTGMGDGSLNTAARLNGELQVFGQSLKEFTAVLAGPGLKTANLVLPMLSAQIGTLARVSEFVLGPVNDFLNKMDAIQQALDNFFNPAKQDDKVLNELKKQTKTLSEMKDGIYGGGPNARSSGTKVRGGPTNDALERAIQSRELGSGLL